MKNVYLGNICWKNKFLNNWKKKDELTILDSGEQIDSRLTILI